MSPQAIASSPDCTFQAIVHDELPLYGTQFHPDFYDDDPRDGRKMIQEFLSIAGVC
jgi:GMP synthase-like glutamine amidotransferase